MNCYGIAQFLIVIWFFKDHTKQKSNNLKKYEAIDCTHIFCTSCEFEFYRVWCGVSVKQWINVHCSNIEFHLFVWDRDLKEIIFFYEWIGSIHSFREILLNKLTKIILFYKTPTEIWRLSFGHEHNLRKWFCS